MASSPPPSPSYDDVDSSVEWTHEHVALDALLFQDDDGGEGGDEHDAPSDHSIATSVDGRSTASSPPPVDDTNHGVIAEQPFLLRHTLRSYQMDGLRWLVSLHNKGLNGILADEMGLGKTIQTIALFAYLAGYQADWGPHLIVVPTSVLLNWTEKRRGWSAENAFHVCITTYQLVLQDQAIFRRRRWAYLVLDEAHNIKNFRSQRWQTLLGFRAQHRLLLTGTPLQNNLTELWSLLYFLMPDGVVPSEELGFASAREFHEWFGRPIDQIIESIGHPSTGRHVQMTEIVRKLHTLLRPYLLRRIKADVEQQLPGKYEHTVWCRLAKRQRQLYDDFMARARTRETLVSGNYMSIINCLMQLRKVCNHPDLFEPRPVTTPFPMADIRIGFPDKRLLQYDCGKLQVLAQLLRQLKEHGHRTLIFTQMTRMLDVLEAFLNLHGYRYLRLDGATKVDQRQLMTERFNADERIFAFILSTRSGGVGINLTGADSVIFYDSDWNPFMDKQCQDRCHRIGQTRDVHIYRLVSEHTIESNILRKANQKRLLDDVVIQEGDFTTDFLTRVGWRDALGLEDLPQASDKEQLLSDMPEDLDGALAQVEDADDVAALQQARKEATEADLADRADYKGQAAAHTGQGNGRAISTSPPWTTPSSNATSPAASNGVGQEEEEEGDIEEYMLRQAEWNYRLLHPSVE
ncbi:P-loop containing nucleoside triphosphate hydrolase protein [Syncephalis pseudoplumigaleata]|uniref:P-loop containing nucleoside triphosphate hydrolase protein n=1 Tax=Syncephalis pseudoplumigaleata TaxID=1712513 RepID=A0A4P9Z064_9FUNG|nr:P-loop containing nucleoside triphosphate hydrolase protein [Syncephalis pseudoplumigaleata]|eukprot:RKP25843.1 P-loop containing nucleoside triphosphate hydrolase protein [Syncephalis pseudoplumigaleata]